MVIDISHNTSAVHQRDRFAYWQDAVCDSYVLLGCETADPSRFAGAISGRRVGDLSVSNVGGAQQIVRRRAQDIRRANDDDFLLSLQLRTKGQLSQGHREAELNPGDMVLYDSAREYAINLRDGFEQIVFQIPRALLLARVPEAEDLTGLRIPGDADNSRLARDSLQSFAGHVLSAPPQSDLMRELLVDLVGFALSGIHTDVMPKKAPPGATLLRARKLIEAHFRDPEFTRNSLSGLMGISVRRLNELFASDGDSISGAIRDQRLRTASCELRAPEWQHLSVTDIALRNGFSSSSHFSHSFSQLFHQSPRAFRQSETG